MSVDESDIAREEFVDEVLAEYGLDYVLEAKFEEVRRKVEETEAQEWLARSGDWLQLLSIVSQYDRERFRRSVRAQTGAGSARTEANDEIRLFNVASEVSKFLESLLGPRQNDEEEEGQERLRELTGRARYGYRSGAPVPALAPYSKTCTLEGSLEWASDLVSLARSFREILLLKAEPDRILKRLELSSHVKALDDALVRGAQLRLVFREDVNRGYQFSREHDPTATPLSAAIANWMSDYFSSYSQYIDLGVCLDCARVFSKQRRDNAYCSKTCQNRVAYKRRKLFADGLLRKIQLNPFNPSANCEKLKRGVRAYHARFGLGTVEAVDMRGGLSVTVRFPLVVRTFHERDLVQEGSSPANVEFYGETDSEALAELL